MKSGEAHSLIPELDEMAIARAAEIDRLRAFNERSIAGAISAFFGIALLLWVLWTAAGWQRAALWALLMVPVELAIFAAGMQCRRALETNTHLTRWRNVQIGLAGLAGAAWGSAVWFVSTGVSDHYYFLTVTIVVGVAGISMVTMAAYARASALYACGINLLPLLHVLLYDMPMAHFIAAGLLVALVVQIGYCREIRLVMLRDADQHARNVVLVERLSDLLTHDQLTGAYSRRYVFDQLERLVSNRQRHGAHATVIMFDLDHFKAINDRYGHPTGDRALGEAVRTVYAQPRSGWPSSGRPRAQPSGSGGSTVRCTGPKNAGATRWWRPIDRRPVSGCGHRVIHAE